MMENLECRGIGDQANDRINGVSGPLVKTFWIGWNSNSLIIRFAPDR
jgi:hypothetical protein